MLQKRRLVPPRWRAPLMRQGWRRGQPRGKACGGREFSWRNRRVENFGRRRHDCRYALRLRPYPLTERYEIGAGPRQHADLVEACGIADAGYFEQTLPPLKTLLHFREIRRPAATLTLRRAWGRG